jgi:hypothetical protein
MKTADLVIAANTIWVASNGGTHGSPVGPLLPYPGAIASAALGQSPAPPASRISLSQRMEVRR